MARLSDAFKFVSFPVMAAPAETKAAPQRISFNAYGTSEISVIPIDFLGEYDFQRFIRVCRDHLNYDRAKKRNYAPIIQAGRVIEAFRAEGFAPVCSPDVADAIKRHAADATAAAAKHVETLKNKSAAITTAVAAIGEREPRLFHYQREGAAMIQTLPCGGGLLLADQMGLGKTAQVLVALHESAPVMVVCPASVKGVWQSEAKKWRPDFRVTVLSGRGSFRWPTPGEIAIINYDLLADDASVQPAGVILVADEAHMLKGRTKRTARFRALSDAARAKMGVCILLTATPLVNRPPELWTVLDMAGLAKTAFKSRAEFLRLCATVHNEYGGTYTNANRISKDVPEKLAKVMLRRTREDVALDLPPKMRQDQSVEGLDPATRAAADAAWTAITDYLAEKGTTLAEAFEASFGLAFEQLSAARAALANAKMPALLEVVEQYEDAGEPLIVFSAHLDPVEICAAREGWEKITGDVPPEQRSLIVEEFQAGRLKGLACTIRAAGLGLTLTRAAHAVFCDLDWTPAANAQAEDRIYRIGQDRPVHIIRLIAEHPLDEKVAEILAEKQQIISATVEAKPRTASKLDDIAAETLARAADEAARLAATAEAVEVYEQTGPVYRAGRRGPETQIEADSIAKIEAGLAAGKVAMRDDEFARSLVEQAGTIGLSNKQWPFVYSIAKRIDTAGEVARGPESPAETWAMSGIMQLAAMDRDRATAKNEMGFNRFDGRFGHAAAEALATSGTLKPTQWAIVVKMCGKYRRQIGAPPAGVENDG